MPGLLRAGRRIRPGRRPHARPSRRRRTSSSTARRSGRRSRTSPTGASCSRAVRSRLVAAHDGLTYLIVDMHAPGRRGAAAAPDHRRGRVQRDLLHRRPACRVENVLGEVGGGWQVAMTTLLHERGTLGLRAHGRARGRGAEVWSSWLAIGARRRCNATRSRASGSSCRRCGYTAYRSLSALMRTGVPGPEGSILKLQWSEANQRVTKLALELLGPDAQLLAGNAPYGGYWQHQQLRSRGNTIEAGTSEILRNIVAERVLGLPRGRADDGLLLHARAGGAPRAGASVPGGDAEPSWRAARRARLDRRLRGRGAGRRRARLPGGGGPLRGDRPRPHPCPVLLDDRLRPAGAAARAAGRVAAGEDELGARARTARGGPRYGHARGRRRRRRRSTSSSAPIGRCCRRATRRARSASSWAARPAERLASSERLPALRSRSLAALALEACGVGAPRARARG